MSVSCAQLLEKVHFTSNNLTMVHTAEATFIKRTEHTLEAFSVVTMNHFSMVRINDVLVKSQKFPGNGNLAVFYQNRISDNRKPSDVRVHEHSVNSRIPTFSFLRGEEGGDGVSFGCCSLMESG